MILSNVCNVCTSTHGYHESLFVSEHLLSLLWEEPLFPPPVSPPTWLRGARRKYSSQPGSLDCRLYPHRQTELS